MAVVLCSDVIVDRVDLVALLDALGEGTTAVAFVRGRHELDRVRGMAALGIPCVAGLPVTDATKRVDGDVVVETVDRSTLFTVDLPILVPAGSLASAEFSGVSGAVHLAELCGDDAIAVMDKDGGIIARL